MSDVDTKEAAHGDPKVEAPVGLTVNVTPTMAVGEELICEIDPAAGTSHRYVKGGLIKLPGGGNYTITFALVPTDDFPNLQFDTNDPFWSSDTCPDEYGNDGQLSPQTPCNNTSLVVDATPRPPKNALHYRLNLTNNGSQLYCDPIIINN